MPDFLAIFFYLLLFLIILLALTMIRQVVVYEHERGLLYRNGQFRRLLAPGSYWYWKPVHMVQKVDLRTRFVTLPGQEVLTADNISLKISLATSYKVSDPHQAVRETVNYQEALYLLLQVQLRDLVGSYSVDELLEKRQEIGQRLLEGGKIAITGLGLELVSANLKDIMFPGELKNIFAQVVNARKEGLAALERARGESASLRNLANAARLLENNPQLFQLRLLQTLTTTNGNTILFGLAADEAMVKQAKGKHKDKDTGS